MTPDRIGPDPKLSARERMMRAVERLGIRACSYSIDTWAVPCDCKTGIESDKSPHERYYCGEQTGCPELRTLHLLLSDMTDAEYDEIHGRNMQRLIEAFDDA